MEYVAVECYHCLFTVCLILVCHSICQYVTRDLLSHMVKFGAHAYTKLITNYSNFTVKTLNYDCDVPEGPFSLCS